MHEISSNAEKKVRKTMKKDPETSVWLMRAWIETVLAVIRRHPLPVIQHRLYRLLYASTPVRGLHFFNYGYYPKTPDLIAIPRLDREPYQVTMYHQVLAAASMVLGKTPANIVEVACSHGGGLLYTAAYFPGTEWLLGFDLQPSAVATARTLSTLDGRLRFAAASGHALPLAGGSAALIVCVEALMNMQRFRFLGEAARILIPGGALAVTGSWKGDFPSLGSSLTTESGLCGLDLMVMNDITSNILAASERDAPRRLAAIAQGPRIARRYLHDFLLLPGSAKFNAYLERQRCYYLAVFRKPASSSP